MYVKWREQRRVANNAKVLFGGLGGVNRDRAREFVRTNWMQTRLQVHRKGRRTGRPIYKDATDRWISRYILQ